MKKFLSLAAAAVIPVLCAAQEPSAAQIAAEEAAKAINEAPVTEPAKPRFADFWSESLKTNLTFGQTSLVNWAAGGDNTFSLAAHVDGVANYKKDLMFWNNRLQLDYGFLWASSKPITQKNNDRIYLESRWGYQIQQQLFFSASYDFKSQFTKGWVYNTPETKYQDRLDAEGNPVLDGDGNVIQDAVPLTRKDWRDARVAKSGFISPAYTTLALGIDWKPKPWFSLSFAPLTGGYTIVANEMFRTIYGMELKKDRTVEDLEKMKAGEDFKALSSEEQSKAIGEYYKGARFQFGALLKLDLKAQINNVFTYTTQFALFEDYIKNHKTNPCPRINWDNRIDWKLAKYFALTVTTNMIYDDYVMIKTDKWQKKCAADEAYKAAHPNGIPAVQFMESLSFGFTYTIASKK